MTTLALIGAIAYEDAAMKRMLWNSGSQNSTPDSTAKG